MMNRKLSVLSFISEEEKMLIFMHLERNLILTVEEMLSSSSSCCGAPAWCHVVTAAASMTFDPVHQLAHFNL